MPTPSDKKSVQRLLGMTNFVQRFSPKLSEIAEPLRQLIRKDTEFCWNAEHTRGGYRKKSDRLTKRIEEGVQGAEPHIFKWKEI